MPDVRTTIRTRLALVHAAVFAAMAIVLVCGIYALTSRSLPAQSADPRSRVERALGLPAGTLVGTRPLRRPPVAPVSPQPDRRTLQRVAAGVQTQTRSELLSRLLTFSAALVLATTALTFAIGWITAGRSLRPLRRITARARTLSENDLSDPIALEGPSDELRELADTFDEMLARLDRAFAAQRLFAANASHELRSPLTRIRTKLDVTLGKPEVTRADLEEMGTSIRGAIDRSAALIESMLVLARARGQLLRREVAVDELASAALTALQGELAERRIAVTSTLGSCTVSGDPFLLEQLVRNVVENAVLHNVDGGWMHVRTEANGIARLRVANSGALPPDSSVDDLFLPLHRGSPDRIYLPVAGFGLGLSIVREVSEAHGGRVTAEPLADGGLSVEVALPRAEPASAREAATFGQPSLPAAP